MGATIGAQPTGYSGILWKLCRHSSLTTCFRIFSRTVWVAICLLCLW